MVIMLVLPVVTPPLLNTFFWNYSLLLHCSVTFKSYSISKIFLGFKPLGLVLRPNGLCLPVFAMSPFIASLLFVLKSAIWSAHPQTGLLTHITILWTKMSSHFPFVGKYSYSLKVAPELRSSGHMIVYDLLSVLPSCFSFPLSHVVLIYMGVCVCVCKISIPLYFFIAPFKFQAPGKCHILYLFVFHMVFSRRVVNHMVDNQ